MLAYNPKNHYWIVGGSTTQVFSSALGAYVLITDPNYTAFLAQGRNPTGIPSEAELWEVLSLTTPGAINKRITADRTTSSLTAVNVPDMLFTVGALEVWAFEMSCHVGSSSAAGFKIGFGAFAGATLKAQVKGSSGAPSTIASELMTAFGALGAQAWCANITNNGWLDVRGIVRAGNTSGVLQLQAAKITSGNATLFTDSYLVARRLGG